MVFQIGLAIVVAFAVHFGFSSSTAAHPPRCKDLLTVQSELGGRLSKQSAIISPDQAPPRWSSYMPPQPKIVVNVAQESDVAEVVRYANDNGFKFTAQAGGSGWATTFDLGKCGILIRLAGLNSTEFSADKTHVTLGGGITIGQAIAAAYENDARIANPNCPCVGVFGGALGGGLTRLSSLYGLAVDQIQSMSVVLADGKTKTASRTTNKDLFYALRGAAPNFGIVTSAVLKAYPTPKDKNIGWQGRLLFEDEKVEKVAQAIASLDLDKHPMQVDLIFLTNGPPQYKPIVEVFPLYIGKEADARRAFKPVLDLKPYLDEAKEMPYSEWSDWAIPFCIPGPRRPTYGVSSKNLDPRSVGVAYDKFKSFIGKYGEPVGFSSILIENYAMKKARELDDGTSSFPWRDLTRHIAILPWYEDPSFDKVAVDFATNIRSILRANDGVDKNSTYINFAHGDETLEDIYGKSLKELTRLKEKWDPRNRFGQWFPIKTKP